MIDAILKQYIARANTAIETARIKLGELTISEHASATAVSAYQSMAAAALGAINTVVSSAISAAA